MSKTVKTVFLIIGLLVLIFIVWQLVFNDGGILKTGYNAMAEGINRQWHKVAGSGSDILATWGDNADDNGTGFDIDTNKTGN